MVQLTLELGMVSQNHLYFRPVGFHLDAYFHFHVAHNRYLLIISILNYPLACTPRL
jgi:hypothetical protein